MTGREKSVCAGLEAKQLRRSLQEMAALLFSVAGEHLRCHTFNHHLKPILQGLPPSSAEGVGLTPSWGGKIPHGSRPKKLEHDIVT